MIWSRATVKNLFNIRRCTNKISPVCQKASPTRQKINWFDIYSITSIKINYRMYYGTPHVLANLVSFDQWKHLLRLRWALASISMLELVLEYYHDIFSTIHRIPFCLDTALPFSWDIMRARSRLKFTCFVAKFVGILLDIW